MKGESTMFKTLVALVCTILTFFFSSAIVAILHLPEMFILLFFPIVAIIIGLWLDSHHFYD